MADQMFEELKDDDMTEVNGGIIAHIPFGFICEGIVTLGSAWKGSSKDSSFTGLNVEGDDGKIYGCAWNEGTPPEAGTRVRISHMKSGSLAGCYVAEPKA